MALATILGFPRIGFHRELKKNLENFWSGAITQEALLASAARLRAEHWAMQKAAGMAILPANDFSLYDHVLDMAVIVGAIPERFSKIEKKNELDVYFAMARGIQSEAFDLAPQEMTKWFDTNYHYIVPEFTENQTFSLSSTKPISELREAVALGYAARPVLLGPVSFLLLGKGAKAGLLLDRLLPVYAALLEQLEKEGATWVQFDEPVLALDLDATALALFQKAYDTLRKATTVKFFLASMYGSMGANLEKALALPVEAVHLDLTRGMDDLNAALVTAPADMTLSLGIVDGRNVWRNDLSMSMDILERVAEKRGNEKLWISSSCSLLHVPYDVSSEKAINAEVRGWLSFAKQKMEEISAMARGLNEGRGAISDELDESSAVQIFKDRSLLVHNPGIAKKCDANPLSHAGRLTPSNDRKKIQTEKLKLPLYPTTTIGSFPQTAEVRQHRADLRERRETAEAYETFIKDQIQKAIDVQEEVGLDILVHGEFERNDMVEYFAEYLTGFAVTQDGWVQSYGSRCVKPPIIYGDVERKKPMTVYWSVFAQNLTKKPVKGMLTGPVTMLQWSFVREDQPRQDTAHQIALAIRDEALDLEAAGLKVIQIDEPAFREGLPLRKRDWRAYLDWAVRAFCMTYTGVKDETQIHTHMCYSEFNDIISSIRELDADVIAIESSRSKMEILNAFRSYKYPNDIGLGVYDIHSPRVPSEDEMTALIEAALKMIPPSQVWVNPDCGLKTRAWPEVKASLANMVAAAKKMREKIRERGL